MQRGRTGAGGFRLLAFFLLLACDPGPPPRDPPAPGRSARPATSRAAPAAPSTAAAAPVDAGPPPPRLDLPRPRSFGVAPCDQYVLHACACPNPWKQPAVCRRAHDKFEAYRVGAKAGGMARNLLAQDCVDQSARLTTACPPPPASAGPR